jgi:probable addiction module antidote protein
MPKRTQSYKSWQLGKLSDPNLAAGYLNSALEESQEMFLIALRKVAQAQQMARVAKEANIQRETLYHALSEVGNPTLQTLTSVLDVLQLDLAIKPKMSIAPATPVDPIASQASNRIADGSTPISPTFTVNSWLPLSNAFQVPLRNTYSAHFGTDVISRALGRGDAEIDSRPLGAITTSLPKDEQQQLMEERNVAA